jgi:hypothetical protein
LWLQVINPGAREIQFLEHTGARETSLPIELPPRGFDIGASITCNGVMDKGDDRFSLNLGIGIGDSLGDGEIALHVNPRFQASGQADTLVLNTREGGAWGTEDRDTVPPFRVAQAFQVSILATADGYQVAFPGHPYAQHIMHPFQRLVGPSSQAIRPLPVSRSLL